MTTKFLVQACKDVNVGETWFIKTSEIEIEAENETDAEWKVRKMGYSPIYTKTL